MAPLTLFEEPAPPPLIVEPVALMRLAQLDQIEELEEAMERYGLAPHDFWCETKFNGWLVQSAGGRLFSRRGKELTEKFPEIARFMSVFTTEHLVGELVYWTPDGIMHEPSVTSVAGTADPEEAIEKLENLPGHFEMILFDAIAVRGYDIARLSTEERREILIETVKPSASVRITDIYPYSKWPEIYEEGIARQGDGVVFKNRHSPYVWRPSGKPEAKPAGTWYKLKPMSSDEFVVYDTSYGPKGKLLLHLGQYHHGELIEIGTVGNLSGEMEREMLKMISKGPFVVEVGYLARYPEPPGPLQDPRFLRVRLDKEIEDAELPSKYAP